uniref:glutathione transferase n=1 Tax=Polytomella parva TaxID=51329 RepID=A0A7S0V6R1_9CHLO
MPRPTIFYFPLRGRAEVIKLVLSYAKVEFDVENIDYNVMKKDRTLYPFGQCPRFADGVVDICQSNTILRYLARKYDLNGKAEADTCAVDMIMEGVESLRIKYVNLIYNDKLEESAMEKYWQDHFDASTTEGRNGGAHMLYLRSYIKESGFCLESGISMADFCLFDLVDLHIRIFEDKMNSIFPDLVEFHARMSELPGVKEYVAGPLRLARINGNDLG